MTIPINNSACCSITHVTVNASFPISENRFFVSVKNLSHRCHLAMRLLLHKEVHQVQNYLHLTKPRPNRALSFVCKSVQGFSHIFSTRFGKMRHKVIDQSKRTPIFWGSSISVMAVNFEKSLLTPSPSLV